MRKQHLTILKAVVLCVFIVGILANCGKKGPPLPPIVTGKKLAAVRDIQIKPYRNGVMLAWDHQVDEEKAFVEPESFEVFSAQKTLDDCEGCPFVFTSAAVVSLPDKKAYIPLDKGFIYYFRIQAIGDDNVRSEYSKTIQFDNL